MTSIQLFAPTEHNPKVPLEWGTGNTKDQPKELWVPKPPTWHQKDIPIQQFYTLTQLKKSNVRLNDQLLPEPNDIDMGKLMIRRPFPAEHPYSSHTSRLAVFPSFTCAEDPDRGAFARTAQPIGPETPAANYDVRVLTKIKGHPHRWEFQDLPPESRKKGLTWKGEDGFHHLYKEGGVNPTEFYPWPPKTVRPNLMTDRPENLRVSTDTAIATRNIERSQWKTSYSLDHTDSAQSNPLNLDDKNLPQRFVTIHDPARPMEGRTHRQIAPYRPAPPTTLDSWEVKRKPTLHEREEDRLHHGTQYKNYPETADIRNPPQWMKLDFRRHPDVGFGAIDERAEEEEADEVPEETVSKAGPGETKRVRFLDDMKLSQHERNQQIEAQNRYQVLELQKPSHDISALNHKYSQARPDEHPHTFYSHEGRYNEERAGLYNTNYDPYRQYQSMGARTEDEIMNTQLSHVDAVNDQTQLSYDMGLANCDSKTKPWERTRISGRVSPREPHNSYANHRTNQKTQLQPTLDTARDRVQENGFINRESEHGDYYNSHKFLQENELDRNARAEPMVLMSTQNQNLSNVRNNARVKPVRLVRLVPAEDIIMDRPSTAPFQPTSEKFLMGSQKDCIPSSTNQFASNSGNIAPQGLSRSWTNMSAYGNQYPAYDLTNKHDSRFDFVGGVGAKKPQTKLMKLQDSFFKSNAHANFHRKYSEKNADLRENIDAGKQHDFDGMNAQVLRG